MMTKEDHYPQTSITITHDKDRLRQPDFIRPTSASLYSVTILVSPDEGG